MKVNSKLRNYIEKNIIDKYKYFDKGHDISHVEAVISRSLKYFNKLNKKYFLDINIVYTVAAYHDYGMIVARDKHSYYSSQLVLKDENLKQWFNKKEIKLIAEACLEHSTSMNVVPKTIYGKIVADADKDTNVKIGKYLGQKCYILAEKKDNETIEIKKIAGAPSKLKEEINFKNFKYNFSSNANLYPKYRVKNVKGGVVLVPTSFTIKEK